MMMEIPQFPSAHQLLAWAQHVYAYAMALVTSPTFWLQWLLIGVVFLIAHWVLAPPIKKGVAALARRTERVPAFKRLWAALEDSSTPIGWLLLQRIAINVAAHYEINYEPLHTVSSLVTAWILIRLASAFVSKTSTARIVAVSAWAVAALNIFHLLDPTMKLLDSWALEIGEVRLSPLGAIKILIALWLALWFANAIASLVERRLAVAKTTNAATRVLVGKLTRITLVAIAILTALSSVGIDLTSLAIFSGALGVGLGFGLQKIFSNLVSGIILLAEGSIKPGDVLNIGSTFGWVNRLGLRYTSVITRDGIEHLIPNEELITQRVENWSFSNDLVRLRVPIGISYDSDVRLAMRLCLEAAAEVPRVKKKPDPRVQLMGFGDSSVDLELRIWIDDPPNGRANVISEVLLGVWDRFHEHGVEIPFPQRDLHLRSVMGKASLSDLKEALAREEGRKRVEP